MWSGLAFDLDRACLHILAFRPWAMELIEKRLTIGLSVNQGLGALVFFPSELGT